MSGPPRVEQAVDLAEELATVSQKYEMNVNKLKRQKVRFKITFLHFILTFVLCSLSLLILVNYGLLRVLRERQIIKMVRTFTLHNKQHPIISIIRCNPLTKKKQQQQKEAYCIFFVYRFD